MYLETPLSPNAKQVFVYKTIARTLLVKFLNIRLFELVTWCVDFLRVYMPNWVIEVCETYCFGNKMGSINGHSKLYGGL